MKKSVPASSGKGNGTLKSLINMPLRHLYIFFIQPLIVSLWQNKTNIMKRTTDKKEPAYRTRLRSDRAAQLFVKILEKLATNKLYRDPKYTAQQLAQDLQTNTRYISAAVALHTGDNYNALVNSYRLRDACRMLRSSRYAHLTAEEIGLMSGFSSRQAFYLAFHRTKNCTPRQYRLGHNG